MKRGGWVELVGKAVDMVWLTVREATRTVPSGSALLLGSSSRRKGSSDDFTRGGVMARFSRVRSS